MHKKLHWIHLDILSQFSETCWKTEHAALFFSASLSLSQLISNAVELNSDRPLFQQPWILDPHSFSQRDFKQFNNKEIGRYFPIFFLFVLYPHSPISKSQNPTAP